MKPMSQQNLYGFDPDHHAGLLRKAWLVVSFLRVSETNALSDACLRADEKSAVETAKSLSAQGYAVRVIAPATSDYAGVYAPYAWDVQPEETKVVRKRKYVKKL